MTLKKGTPNSNKLWQRRIWHAIVGPCLRRTRSQIELNFLMRRRSPRISCLLQFKPHIMAMHRNSQSKQQKTQDRCSLEAIMWARSRASRRWRATSIKQKTGTVPQLSIVTTRAGWIILRNQLIQWHPKATTWIDTTPRKCRWKTKLKRCWRSKPSCLSKTKRCANT